MLRENQSKPTLSGMKPDNGFKKILWRFYVAYFSTITLLFFAVTVGSYYSNYKNKYQIAENISNIVEGKLKTNARRDVVTTLSAAHIKNFEAIGYFNAEGQRIISFPTSLNSKFFNKRNDLFYRITHTFISINIYFDSQKKIKAGTIVFSFDPFESIRLGLLVWIFGMLILIPVGIHYKNLIVSNFENRAAKERNRIIKEIISLFRHDARGAMQSIQTVIDTSETIDKIERGSLVSAIKRLVGIVNNLNKFEGSGEIFDNPVDGYFHLITLIREFIAEKQLFCDRTKANIDIEFNFDKSLLGIYLKFDETNFKRAAANIINNAHDAIVEKGKKGTIDINATKSNSTIKITIFDNGIGMDKSILARIGNKGISFKQKGSGLGLYGAKKIISGMGGDLKINSDFGIGTQINITIPLGLKPVWSTDSINLHWIETVVILDDDISFFSIWRNKLKEYLNKPLAKMVELNTYDSLKDWISSSEIDYSKTLFLIDYDLGKYEISGTEIIKKHLVGHQTYLVTNNFDNPKVQSECEKNRIKLVPKTSLDILPMII